MKNNCLFNIYIDFNKMIATDVVFLSKTGTKEDSIGEVIRFYEGKKVSIYVDDYNEGGQRDYLIAIGCDELNKSGLFKSCKWVRRIDSNGIKIRLNYKSALVKIRRENRQ